MRNLAVMAIFGMVALSGCLSDDSDELGAGPGAAVLGQPLDEPLWNDPQNFPHPNYNYPTLSSPAANAQGWHAPINGSELPATIGGMELVASTSGTYNDGGGIALYGSLAVVPGFNSGTSAIFDISDPTNPEKVGEFVPQLGGTHRGATIIAYPDGKIVTVISMGSGLDSWDITDPTNPQPLPPVEMSSHKVGVVPGTPIVYNAKSTGGSSNGLVGEGHLPGGGSSVTEIYDFTNPEEPVHVMDWENGYSCHHVYFFNYEDKQRGLCAGIEVTQIWDTTDPLNPTVIVDVPVHLGIAGTPSLSIPIVAFSHFAGLSLDGNTLLVGDEMGGGGLPPGCVAEVRTPAGSISTPIGALWFYDVSDETSPRLLGWYSPLNDPTIKDLGTSCTAHHGRLVPMEGQDLIAMSFYGAGVILLDFTNPSLPVVVDQFADGSNTWETWYYDGYLFTGDLNRGMDVLRLV